MLLNEYERWYSPVEIAMFLYETTKLFCYVNIRLIYTLRVNAIYRIAGFVIWAQSTRSFMQWHYCFHFSLTGLSTEARVPDTPQPKNRGWWRSKRFRYISCIWIKSYVIASTIMFRSDTYIKSNFWCLPFSLYEIKRFENHCLYHFKIQISYVVRCLSLMPLKEYLLTLEIRKSTSSIYNLKFQIYSSHTRTHRHTRVRAHTHTHTHIYIYIYINWLIYLFLSKDCASLYMKLM